MRKSKWNEKANFEIVMPKASLFLKLDLWYREAKAKQSAGIETCTINMNKVVHNDVQWQCELFLQSMWLKRDDQRSMQSDMQSVTCKVKVESWKCHIQSEQRKLNHVMDDSFWFSTANFDPLEYRKLIATTCPACVKLILIRIRIPILVPIRILIRVLIRMIIRIRILIQLLLHIQY